MRLFLELFSFCDWNLNFQQDKTIFKLKQHLDNMFIIQIINLTFN